MKKIKTSIVLVILSVLLISCNRKVPENNISNSNKAIQSETETNLNLDSNEKEIKKALVQFEYEVFSQSDKNSENDLQGQIPYTDIYLIIKGEIDEVHKIGTYVGEAYSLEEFKDYNLPEETVSASFSYYAGYGEVVFLVREADKLKVKSLVVEEGIESENRVYKNLLEIEVDEDIEVKPYSFCNLE
ncbi:hypothetical protein SH2C18_06880 [Clostridium sediminicola]|uniref:hypothetical protein n=1 Tax=Clostridium sediminicola TaxID=3114879 RepID=UPI0031F1E6FB